MVFVLNLGHLLALSAAEIFVVTKPLETLPASCVADFVECPS